jgi:cobalt/nickel transport system permease protein
MHMADALLSPGLGLALWAASGTALALASRRVRERADDRLVPLMGMLGAFVFAAQMINFTIPGTGSSGHLGGGLLLALLLGPHAAFVVIASVLTVQALFFADGGLLALGANLFNLGVLPCFVAWPLVYRPLAAAAPSRRREGFAVVFAAIVGLQLGALGVVLQTTASGISSLPTAPFLALMSPIHLGIGLVEGFATLAIVRFLQRAQPGLMPGIGAAVPAAPGAGRRLWVSLALATAIGGGVLSWFASAQPDGLEWSVARLAGPEEPAAPSQGLHASLARWQRQLAWLPGYDLPAQATSTPPSPTAAAAAWPDIRPGTSLAGVAGALATLAVVMAAGMALRRRRRRG